MTRFDTQMEEFLRQKKNKHKYFGRTPKEVRSEHKRDQEDKEPGGYTPASPFMGRIRNRKNSICSDLS